MFIGIIINNVYKKPSIPEKTEKIEYRYRLSDFKIQSNWNKPHIYIYEYNIQNFSHFSTTIWNPGQIRTSESEILKV
jgi:hypothetical protein